MSEGGEHEFESYASTVSDEQGEDGLDDLAKPECAVRITKELIKEVQKELCLIKLCWPEVDLRQDLYLKTLPNSYCTVSGKEKVLAWYAENFRSQFQAKYPDRKPLLLMCENECGIQKFVSTTIRRSTLPYPELYMWQECAKFVSDYITYEPLDKPFGMPTYLRSPTWVEKFQKGNCFEFATFLASLLLGEGYNAYVVSGYAVKEITLCDLTKTKCPYFPQPKTRPCTPEQTEEICKYELKLKLNTDDASKTEIVEAPKVKKKPREEKRRRLIRHVERPPVDEYYGHRVHAWVAILPELEGLRKQEIPCTLFIEPTTGTSYKTTDSSTARLYLGIESIWNDQNYWVNMQSMRSCQHIKWDLTKTEHWEHLLAGEPWTIHESDNIEGETSLTLEKHLDMPFSYVNEIIVSDQNYVRRYPNGIKLVSYEKVKVEHYAPYVQTDGLMQRFTEYNDHKYEEAVNIYEYYANREDKLVECRKNIPENSIIDYYARGRGDQCKEHRYFSDGLNTVDSERIIEFYDVARFDGLSRIEMHPTYIMQHFIDRDDFLYYRYVEFIADRNNSVTEDIHYRQIWKIIEKFNRNEEIKPNQNIAIREFAIGENEIRLTYHYRPGQCSRAMQMFVKPPLPERGERLVLNFSMIQGYSPMNEPVRSLDIFYELQTQLKEEDYSVSYVRNAELEVHNFLTLRNKEYLNPKLVTSAYDKLRDRESASDLFAGDWAHVQSQRNIIEEVNYLKPYLARIGNPSKLNALNAYSIKYECINDYKQLLINRANKILHKFEEYTHTLEKLQKSLVQNDEMSREEKDQILEKMNEINFILQTLETRLNRSKELVPKRYKTLMDFLQQNQCLKILELDSK